tara:strand:- start:208 stop:1041 length:834 start_codon:yes stop_codon:yes gene_type:complete
MEESNVNNIDVDIFQLNKKVNISDIVTDEEYKKIITLINKSEAELVIFAENNYPYIVTNSKIEDIQKTLKPNQTVIIGGTRLENNKYYNSLFNISYSSVNFFDKKKLVPFGEFLPLRNILKFMEEISGSNDYTPGKKIRSIKLNNKINYIPVICYEIIFYWQLINNYNLTNDLVINITNDIWFGKLLGPYQHFYLTKMRAAELNKLIIRVSNNGISGIFDSKGKILINTDLDTSQTISTNINVRKLNNYFFTHKVLNYYLILIIFLIFLFNLRKTNE